MQVMEAATPQYYQERPASPYEQAAETVTQTYRLMEDYGVHDLLAPLADYFPDTTDPLQALLNISHDYGWPAEEVASVIIEVANNNQPIFVTEKQFTTLDEQKAMQVGSFVGNFNGQLGLVRFGTDNEVTKVQERPLPDGWNKDHQSAEEWLRRASMAEDITIYFTRGVERLLSQRSTYNLFDATRALEPFRDYGNDCTSVANLIEEKDLYLADEQAEAEDFSGVLKGSVGFAEIDPDEAPIDHDQWQRDQHSIDGQILEAWRNHSDFSTTPEEQQRLKAVKIEEIRQLKVLAKILQNEARYQLRHSFHSVADDHPVLSKAR